MCRPNVDLQRAQESVAAGSNPPSNLNEKVMLDKKSTNASQDFRLRGWGFDIRFNK